MSDLNEKKQKDTKTNTYLAIGLGVVAVSSMLITMFIMSGSKLPT